MLKMDSNRNYPRCALFFGQLKTKFDYKNRKEFFSVLFHFAIDLGFNVTDSENLF